MIDEERSGASERAIAIQVYIDERARRASPMSIGLLICFPGANGSSAKRTKPFKRGEGGRKKRKRNGKAG